MDGANGVCPHPAECLWGPEILVEAASKLSVIEDQRIQCRHNFAFVGGSNVWGRLMKRYIVV